MDVFLFWHLSHDNINNFQIKVLKYIPYNDGLCCSKYYCMLSVSLSKHVVGSHTSTQPTRLGAL